MRNANSILKALLALLMCLIVSAPAEAQRRGQQPAEEVLFPNALREEPKIKPVNRLQRQLKAVYDNSLEEDKQAETEAGGKQLLASSQAGPYEKALVNQLLAQVELGRDDPGRDNYLAAIAYYQAALESGGLTNNQYFPVMQNVAQLQFQEEDYSGAIETFSRYMQESQTETAQLLSLRGNAYYRMENYEQAAADLRKAMGLQDTPDSAVSQMLMASLFELGRNEEAASVAAELLQKEPQNANLVRNLSAIYVNGDQIDKAIEVLADGLQRGVTAEQRDYIELSKMYRYAEQDVKAAELMVSGLSSGVVEPSLEIYRALGEAYYFSENIAQASEAFGKADEFATDGEMALNHARTLAELERWADTKAAANRAISKGVKRPGDAYVILGAAEFGLNNQPAGLAAYREAAKYPETKAMAEAYLRQTSRR